MVLTGTPGLQLPVEAPWAKNVYWMYGVVLEDGMGVGARDRVMRELAEEGIETRAFFHPMHRQPVFLTGQDPRFPNTAGAYPVSERLGQQGLYLPSGLGLTQAQVHEVAGKLAACLGLVTSR
jgi:perosamine synthetase